MGSTRLPGKVLLSLGDTTVLGSTIRQVGKAQRISNIIVATSDTSGDGAVAEECGRLGVPVFRGSLEDVLDRYYKTAQGSNALNICRVTADCPLIDPSTIDRVAGAYENEQCDYISTGRTISTFPDGMDTEIFSFTALEKAWREAKLQSEREHVTPYIWNHPDKFSIKEITHDRDFSKIRVTIDTPADYEVLKKIVADVRPLSLDAIAEYLESHPEVAAINGSIMRDEGYAKSLRNDREIL